jgi:hypothetical protein
MTGTGALLQAGAVAAAADGVAAALSDAGSLRGRDGAASRAPPPWAMPTRAIFSTLRHVCWRSA